MCYIKNLHKSCWRKNKKLGSENSDDREVRLENYDSKIKIHLSNFIHRCKYSKNTKRESYTKNRGRKAIIQTALHLSFSSLNF